MIILEVPGKHFGVRKIVNHFFVVVVQTFWKPGSLWLQVVTNGTLVDLPISFST